MASLFNFRSWRTKTENVASSSAARRQPKPSIKRLFVSRSPAVHKYLDQLPGSCATCKPDRYQDISVFSIQAAEHGSCAFCLVLAELLSRRYSDQELDKLFVYENTDELSIHVEVAPTTPSTMPPHYYLDLYRDDDDAEAVDELTRRFPRRGSIAASGRDDKCVDFAKTRLKTCLEHHELCRVPGKRSLPRRLIYVGDGNSSLKLAEDIVDDESPYAALSYCWGGRVPSTTTAQSIERRKSAISWDELPQTLQDAVWVTQQLGIPYLWVDAMCIIQDSNEDWQVESSKMAQIYQDAIVTIAAVCSENCTQSFLGPRPKCHTRPSIVTIEKVDSSRQSFKAREKIDRDSVNIGHLHSRAWTYQEKILSTRVLSYQDNEVIWECRAGRICECGEHTKEARTDTTETHSTSLSKIFANPDDPRVGNPYEVWRLCVETYTSRSLTYTSDKLPAIAGIARVVQQRCGSRYLAGLWEQSLVKDLLWMAHWQDADDPGYLAKNLAVAQYQAPTFSWASINLKVQFSKWAGLDYRTDVVVVESHCELEGLNPLGEVLSGFLLLEGPWFSLQMQFTMPSFRRPICNIYSEQTASWQYSGSTYPDLPMGETNEFGNEKSLRRLVYGKPFDVVQGVVYCLGLYHIDDSYRIALLLGKSAAVEGAYERLGLLHCERASHGRAELDLIDRLWQHAERRVVRIV